MRFGPSLLPLSRVKWFAEGAVYFARVAANTPTRTAEPTFAGAELEYDTPSEVDQVNGTIRTKRAAIEDPSDFRRTTFASSEEVDRFVSYFSSCVQTWPSTESITRTVLTHTLVSTTVLAVFCGALLALTESVCLNENSAMASCWSIILVSSASDPVTIECAVVAGGAPTLDDTKLMSCMVYDKRRNLTTRIINKICMPNVSYLLHKIYLALLGRTHCLPIRQY